jgi:DNA ligase (NAD+)
MNKIQELVNKLLHYKEAYYNNEPKISDEAFDKLEDDLKAIDPTNSYFTTVGIQAQGEKIKHRYPMLSMAKAKTIDEVQSWLNKITDKKVEIIGEPKIDGLSCSIVYDKGKLQYLSTRGDGEYGRIISHIADYIDIPKTIGLIDRIEVRGELLLSKDTKFENLEHKPLRNLAVGLVNRKDSGLEDLKYLEFIGYQIIGNNIPEFEDMKINLINNLGFITVPYQLFYSIEEIENYFNKYKNEYRNEWLYETDGLILCVNNNNLHAEINSKYIVSHHNHFNIALKPTAESTWTIVEGIKWQVSRQGNLIPVVYFKPVIIGGSEIKNASAHNYENVINLKINEGDEILIEKANEIIPFIKDYKATKEKSEQILEICPSCFSVLQVKGIHLHCYNKDCPERNIQIITYFVQQLELDDISEATIRLLYENDLIRRIKDLYRLDYSQVIDLPGMGEKKIDNLKQQLEKSKGITIDKFLAKLGIDLIGEKAIIKLGIKTQYDFWNFSDTKYKIGQNLISYREKNKADLIDLMTLMQVRDVKETQGKKIMSKGKVCVTGEWIKPRKEIQKDIEGMGYEFSSSVTKDTTILLCENPESGTTKIKKASEKGIKIMSYDSFFS